MWALVRKEFTHLRKFILQVAVIFVAIVILFGQRNPEMTAVYFRILPIVMGMTIPQTIFTYEERGNTFIFLRSLPLRPNQIVAAKYVFSLLLLTSSGLLSLGIITWLVSEHSPIDLNLMILLSSALMALSLYLHFRLGVNSAKTALLVLVLGSGVFVGGILTWTRGQQVLASLLSAELLSTLRDFASTQQSLLVTAVLSAFLLFISYFASAGLFSRRDVTQLP